MAGSSDALPSYVKGEAPCASQAVTAVAHLAECLTKAQGTNNDDAGRIQLRRCSCFYKFKHENANCGTIEQTSGGSAAKEFEYDIQSVSQQCEGYWTQWDEERTSVSDWEEFFHSPAGITCMLLIALVIVALCVWCSWDCIKEYWVRGHLRGSNIVEVVKKKPRQPRAEAAQAAPVSIATVETNAVSTTPQFTEHVDSSDDEENDRMHMKLMHNRMS
eukprot:TRINITY_DN42852_c0_g1_i1.p1 TRINITY_DN42852_c0_g1~~TRINITY_DN42852_c0_g1_i1.p1  ORF type:complete len:217 (+),score=28.57 TRINITY_DN42852_c0_g1_i1:65-715(+)